MNLWRLNGEEAKRKFGYFNITIAILDNLMLISQLLLIHFLIENNFKKRSNL